MEKLIICITGGIASGKTKVSNWFAKSGYFVIDADVIAREVVTKNSRGLRELVNALGEDIIDENGFMDRSMVKEIVFNDPNKLAMLNSITHPLIRSRFKKYSKQNKLKTEFWVIPLLFDARNYPAFDRVLTVDVCKETQIKRMCKRDGVTIDAARKILNSQPSREQRLELSTDVISNESTIEELNERLVDLNQLYDCIS